MSSKLSISDCGIIANALFACAWFAVSSVPTHVWTSCGTVVPDAVTVAGDVCNVCTTVDKKPVGAGDVTGCGALTIGDVGSVGFKPDPGNAATGAGVAALRFHK